jgi:hypothetical protein
VIPSSTAHAATFNTMGLEPELPVRFLDYTLISGLSLFVLQWWTFGDPATQIKIVFLLTI